MTVSWSPSSEAYAAAVRHATGHDYPEDTDDGVRTPDEQFEHNFAGKLAEGVAHEWLEARRIPHSWDASEDNVRGADIDLYGVDVDVKMRYYDNYPDPDLIVTTDRQAADIYLQVDLVNTGDGWDASIAGWITHDDATEVWDPYHHGEPGKEKRLVPRGELRPPGTLLDGIVPIANAAQDGQTATPSQV